METDLDLKLKLLSGQPVKTDVGDIKPLTLKEIIEYGYLDYLSSLSLFTFELTDLIDKKKVEDHDLRYLDFFLALGDNEMMIELEKALSLFLRQDVKIISKSQIIVVGDKENPKILHRENFDTVREVIRWQNALNSDLDNRIKKPKNDKAQKILERLEETREKVKQSKEEEESDIDIGDLISSVASMSNSINKFNVFDLTVFQLYDEYRRLDLIENYHVSVKSMLAGATKIKIKHWSSKLK